MRYKKFGNLDWECSCLGFGGVRFPIIDGDQSKIDEIQAKEMLIYAFEHGVNYIDTAFGYHDGNSERFIGEVLQYGYRDQVKVATKLPGWLVQTEKDLDQILNNQLKKLQTDHIDFYLFHGLNRDLWKKLLGVNALEWAERIQSDGRIGNIGFSFHDNYDLFEEIIKEYDHWKFCQIQYNYMNEDYQAGTRGLHYAAQKGLAVVIMEPLLGGRLANAPMEVQEIWKKSSIERTPAEWGLQWLWNNPEVTIVLSGMSSLRQVYENINYAINSRPGLLSENDIALIEEAREIYKSYYSIPCTNCKYCMPCVNGVNIPQNFSFFNNGIMYNMVDQARRWYHLYDENGRASQCIQCMECENRCPQEIPISKWMPLVDEILSGKVQYESCINTIRALQEPRVNSGIKESNDYSDAMYASLRPRKGPIGFQA